MRRIILLYCLCLFSHAVRSQWTTSGSNIYNSNAGNVGIGNSSPGYKLDMVTGSSNDGLKLSASSGFVIVHSPTLVGGGWNNITQGGDAALIYGGNSSGGGTFGLVIAPWRSGTCGIRLDNNGNVGIATADPKGYQLAVNGSAIFTAAWVKAYSSWPDYVFHPEYNLLSLDSLSHYITTHHHLPDIPSADSVANTGINLGTNQALLLKKIEELTLYLIEQKKELESLKEHNQQLTVQNELLQQLQARMDRLEQDRAANSHPSQK